MKKLLFISLVLSGCQTSIQTDTENAGSNIAYFKDKATGLCFAAITSVNSHGSITSITCVPCDSLKNVEVK